MKRYILIAFLLGGMSPLFSQTSVAKKNNLKDLAGKQIISSTFDNGGNPYIICFWGRESYNSHDFLNVVAGQYKNWQNETGVKIITIAVEEAANRGKVLPFIQSKGWDYEYYIDEDQGYKNLMQVYDIPHIFVFNGNKQMVLQLQSFQAGDELAIYEALKK